MAKHVISVTQDDIDKGERFKSDCCPLARAMRRKWDDAAVGKDDFITRRIENSEEMKEYPLPEDAVLFIRAFDHDGDVGPSSFTLEV